MDRTSPTSPLHLQLSDFLAQTGDQRGVATGLLLWPVAEHAGGSRGQDFLPGLNLAGVDLVPGRQLGHRLLPLHRLQGHLGLESRVVLPPLFRHFQLLLDSDCCLQFRSRTLA